MLLDNAVIMAAGTSSRFAPLSYEKPKALIEVKREVLIERQIKQLRESGIKEIYIENSRNDKRTQELTQLANFANVAVNNSVNADFFQKLFANKN